MSLIFLSTKDKYNSKVTKQNRIHIRRNRSITLTFEMEKF